MKTNPFVTAKKAVKDVVPGDIIVSATTGARLVTGAWRNDQGDFTFFFGLPTVEKRTRLAERCWMSPAWISAGVNLNSQ
jgi:hypothetical protein